MSKIYEYDIVDADCLSVLVKYVNENIDKGWQPLGAFNVITTAKSFALDRYHYYQTMVKERDEG